MNFKPLILLRCDTLSPPLGGGREGLPSFAEHLTGSLTLSHFAAGMLFVGAGLLVTLLLDISQRDKDSQRTPRRWSWPFFWRDNILRFILNLLVAVALIRFWPDIKGEEISMFYCFCTGLCFDSLYIMVRAARKRGSLSPRPPLPKSGGDAFHG